MKKQILLLCLALTSLCSYAQTITVKGVVTSASDKEPMIGATVQVKQVQVLLQVLMVIIH